MEKANIPGTQNEKTLWHGTADKPLNQINRRGFDRGFHGANGKSHPINDLMKSNIRRKGYGVFKVNSAQLLSLKPIGNTRTHIFA